jgi:predicted kinase
MTRAGVLVLTGPPFSGKSSVGKALAADPTWSRQVSIHVEVDSVFSLLLPRSVRSRNDRMLAYDATHALARLLVGRGITPVLECTYARREQRTSLLAALADLPGAPVRVVELHVTPDDAVRRFRERRQATDLDESTARERAEAFPYSDQALRLDTTTAAPEALARDITQWWASEPPAVERDVWAGAGRSWD